MARDRGGGRALGGLYDRYAELVYGTGRRHLGDRGPAEDLVQDGFAAVWRNAGSFDASWASFSTWVYRTTRNRATDLIRRHEARVETVGGDFMPGPGEAGPSGELSRGFGVAVALGRPSPAHRVLIEQAYFDGLSLRKISRRIGTPLGTVKSRTTAALREATLPEGGPTDE